MEKKKHTYCGKCMFCTSVCPEYGKTVHVVFCNLKIRNAGIMAHIVRREYEAFKKSRGFEPIFYIDNSP